MGNEKFLIPEFLTSVHGTERHSRSSRLRAAWKSTKELAATEATMNIKYRPRFLPRPLSTMAFFPTSFARVIVCVGRHVDNDPWDPEDHPLA